MFPSGYVWYSIGGIGLATGIVYSWNGKTGVVVVTTTDLPEGSNLYYTNARAQAGVVASSIVSGDTTHAPSGASVFTALAGKANTVHTHVHTDITDWDAAFTSSFNTNLATKTTDNLTEGATNKYYHSSLFAADFATKTTDNLAEGVTNLYYLPSRVLTDLAVVAISSPTDILHLTTPKAVVDYVTATCAGFANTTLNNLIATSINQNLMFSNALVTPNVGINSRVSGGAGEVLSISAQEALGTDFQGGDLRLNGGAGTGASLGGAVKFFTSFAGVSGTTLRSYVEAFKFSPVGTALGVQAVFGPVTAAQITLLTDYSNPSSPFPNVPSVYLNYTDSALGTQGNFIIKGKASTGANPGGDIWLSGGLSGSGAKGNIGFYGTKVQFETKSTVDPTGIAGSLYYNTTSNSFRYHNGTVWGEVGIVYPFADATTDGILKSVDWNTFNNKQAALTFGDISDVGTDGIIITGGVGAAIGSGVTIAQHVADATHNGYLTSTDWVSFNSKQAAGNYITDLAGDVVAHGPGSVSATIQPGAVTNAKLANMAANSIKGNNTGGSAVALDLTATQVTAMLNIFSSTLQGLVPSSGGGTTNFLRADGSWASPGGNMTTDVFSGDGVTTGFTLSVSPGSVNNTLISISGVVQQKSSYTIVGTALTFSVAPPTGTSNVEVVSGSTLAIGTPANGTVGRTQANVSSLFIPPLETVLTVGVNGTSGIFAFTGTPVWVEVELVGPGAGGSGGGLGSSNGGTGVGATTFDTLIGNPGSSGGQGAVEAGGGGAVVGVGWVGVPYRGGGARGITASPATQGGQGGSGGLSIFGGNGGGSWSAGTATSAEPDSGSGGGGGGCGGSDVSGQGGSAGGGVKAKISGAALTALISSGAAWTIGTGGVGSAGFGTGGAGGNGADGKIKITQYYQ